ncbi:MAG: NAD(P)H-dependent oxidoreductase [Acidobacteriota bacterium]|nr:NAD(P)H-dependent oxidoreductase [Acidobacteriota bacterium]
MAVLLKVDSSPMGERSVSRKLTGRFAEAWLDFHPGGTVIERDLATTHLGVVNEFWVGAAHTPEAERTEEQASALRASDEFIAELQQADEYVFGVAMHNFSIPSTLKLWIDQIVRAGKTFAYGADGPKGLLTSKKATVLLASGGVYSQGTSMAALDFVTPYLRTVLGFIGVTDVTVIAAEGTAQLNSGAVDAKTFLAPSLEKVQAQTSI